MKLDKMVPLCAAALIALVLPLSLPPAKATAGSMSSDSVPTFRVSVDSHPGVEWSYAPSEGALMSTGKGRGRKLGMSMGWDNILGNRADFVIEELEFDPDPFVVNNILVTNPTATTQIYSVGIALPTSFPAPNTISGSILTAVIDSSGDGAATVASAGTAVYRAQIDGSTVATLQSPPFSVSVPPGVLNSSSASFGPSPNGVPVTSDIGILLRFSLTAGDTATIISRFDVVPEPTSFGLALAALGAVIAIRRRSR